MDIEQDNERESGARKFVPAQPEVKETATETSQDAALPKPDRTFGLSESVDDTQEKTRQSDGQNPSRATPSPATQKVSGSGPAIAEHSKDAKAPKGGRQPGAYIKD